MIQTLREEKRIEYICDEARVLSAVVEYCGITHEEAKVQKAAHLAKEVRKKELCSRRGKCSLLCSCPPELYDTTRI